MFWTLDAPVQRGAMPSELLNSEHFQGFLTDFNFSSLMRRLVFQDY